MNTLQFKIKAAEGRLTQKDINEYIDNGCDVNHVEKNNHKTALHYAIEHNRIGIVALLLANGANVNAIDKKADTPLHYAANAGHKDILAILLDQTFLVNMQNKNGDTPLHLACKGSHYEIIEPLLARFADSTIENVHEQTPLMVHLLSFRVAADADRHNQVSLLLKNDIINRLSTHAKFASFNRAGKFSIHDTFQEANLAARGGSRNWLEELMPIPLIASDTYDPFFPAKTLLPNIDNPSKPEIASANEALKKMTLEINLPGDIYPEEQKEGRILKKLKRLSTGFGRHWKQNFSKTVDFVLQNSRNYDPNFIIIIKKIQNDFDKIFNKQTQQQSNLKIKR
jgi:ankyrin repeat protein